MLTLPAYRTRSANFTNITAHNVGGASTLYTTMSLSPPLTLLHIFVLKHETYKFLYVLMLDLQHKRQNIPPTFVPGSKGLRIATLLLDIDGPK